MLDQATRKFDKRIHAGFKELVYYLPPNAIVALWGIAEIILGKVEVSSDPYMNAAWRQTGVKNVTLPTITTLSKVLDGTVLPGWAWRLITGLAPTAIGLGLELGGVGDTSVNVGLQHGAIGALLGGVF